MACEHNGVNGIEEIFGAALAAGDTKAVAVTGTVEIPADAPSTAIATTFPMTRLAAFVMETWRAAVDHRRNSGVDARLRDALLAQTCQYTAEQRQKMHAAGISEKIYSPITNTKIRAAKAMLQDIFQSTGEWPFTLSATPDPEVPAEVEAEALQSVELEVQKLFGMLAASGIQQLPPVAEEVLGRIVDNAVKTRYDEMFRYREEFARIRAKRMERKVMDIMAEGGWVKAFNEYVDNICTYGTGLILGPIPRVMAVNKCRKSKRRGARVYERTYRTIPTYEAVNPMDCYPAPDAKDVDDGPLCIRVKYTANELWQYVTRTEKRNGDTADGWMPQTVRTLLDRYPKGGCKIDSDPYDPIRRMLENKGTEDPKDCTIEGIRCFASVRGSDLIDFGVTRKRSGDRLKYADFYQVEVIVMGGFVVYCRIIDDRLGRPIVKGVFYELPGSWWGECIADKLQLVQSVMNNSIKALMTNMAAASGPMYWMNDISRYIDKDGSGLKVKPHKFWPFQASLMGNSGAPMGVIQVPSNASELLAVWEKMKVQADDDSGIPAYTYGQASGNSGAMRTAQGLAIFTEAASRGMKMVIGTTDRLVTREIVRKTATYVLLYDGDMDLKGDVEVNPAGVMGKILKAQQDQQRLQLLNTVLGSPTLSQMIGAKGIMALFRPSVEDVNINPDDVVPSPERIRELEMIDNIKQLCQLQQAKAEAETAQIEQANAAAAPAPDAGGEAPPKPGSVAERRAAA